MCRAAFPFGCFLEAARVEETVRACASAQLQQSPEMAEWQSRRDAWERWNRRDLWWGQLSEAARAANAPGSALSPIYVQPVLPR